MLCNSAPVAAGALKRGRFPHLKPRAAKKARHLSRPKTNEPNALIQTLSSNPTTGLERARNALEPDAMKTDLPCRDDEKSFIKSHLRNAVNKCGSCHPILMAGMPGTGKTASLSDAIKQLRKDKNVTPFTFVQTNGMRLGTPADFFCALHKELREKMYGFPYKRGVTENAQTEVDEFFRGRRPDDQVVVLLIDEIDHLVTQRQSELYHILELTTSPNAKIILVAISNTMNLLDRLRPSVASRISTIHRVDFQPYTKDQLFNIFKGRLEKHNAACAFDDGILERCAASVQNVTGDARKALQVLRLAVQMAINAKRGDDRVANIDLDMANRSLLDPTPAAQAIRGFSRKTKLLLIALTVEQREQDVDTVSLSTVIDRYEKIKKHVQQTTACVGRVTSRSAPNDALTTMLSRLESSGIVTIQRPHNPDVEDTMLLLGAGLDTEDLAERLQREDDEIRLKELL